MNPLKKLISRFRLGAERKVTHLEQEKTNITFSLGELSVIPHKESDIFVLHCESRLHKIQREEIMRAWNLAMPGRKVLILEAGMRLSVAADNERQLG